MTWAEALVLAWAIGWFVCLLSAPSVLLSRMGRPLAALSWLLALFALPPLALPAWWLIGRTHLARRVARRRRAVEQVSSSLAEVARAGGAVTSPASNLLGVVDLPREIDEGVFPVSGANAARLLVDAEQAYDRWEQAIRGAEDHVHVFFYIFSADPTGTRFRDLLADAAARGVEVRLGYDAIGTLPPYGFFDPIEAKGGRVVPFLPLRLANLRAAVNFRNHRKLLVVDAQLAMVGGINIGDEYLAWHDLAVELRGAAVDQLQEIFADDWFFISGEALGAKRYFGRWRQAPEPDASLRRDVSCTSLAGGPTQQLNAIREMFFVAVTQARERLWIMTPYFIPDAALIMALRAARYRGVDVRVMVPADNDVWLVRRAARAFYPELLQAGIRLFEYPRMLHAKATVIDREFTLIGSANLDTRSLRLNFEIATILHSEELCADLTRVYENDVAESVEILEGELVRSRLDRLVDATAHLLSPLL